MKPIVKIDNWWFFPKGVVAMTLFPFIFVDKTYAENSTFENYDNTINHEDIHFQQQLEMLVLFFYLWYGIEWLIKLIKHGNSSYYFISFEVEAYRNGIDPTYLITRKFWSFLKYVITKDKLLDKF
jgi:hypothetical protein